MASIAKSQNLSKGEMRNENDNENFDVFSVSDLELCSSLGRQPHWPYLYSEQEQYGWNGDHNHDA
jgi:hypothetical protein